MKRKTGDARPRCDAHLRRVLALIGCACIVGTGAGWIGAPAARASVPAGTPVSQAAPALRLVAQSPWIDPGQAFDLQLAVSGTTIPVADRGVSISIYPCLFTRSAFDASVVAGVAQETPQVSTVRPLRWGSLPAPASGPGGSVDVRLGITVSGRAIGPGTPAPGEAGAFDLSCSIGDGGVFPVRVQLVNLATGAQGPGLTTHLVYLSVTDTNRLRFAWDLPVTRLPTPSPQPAGPATIFEPLGPRDLGQLGQVADDLAADPHVPVSLDLTPETLSALSAAGARHTVAQLAAAAGQAGREDVGATWVPVDPSQLARSGLGGDLDLQLTAGRAALRSAGIQPAATPPPAVLTGPIDPAGASVLAGSGVSRLVVPSRDLPASTQSPTGSSASGLAVTGITSSGAALEVLPAASELTDRFAAAGSDPVLAAHQLLAELVQIYLEDPNLVATRTVVGVPPAGWTPSPAFVSALLAGLTGNPVVQSETLSSAFASVPMHTAPARNAFGSSGPPAAQLPAAQLLATRAQIAGLAGALPADAATAAGAPLAASLDGALLTAESTALRPAQQAAAVRSTSAAIGRLLAPLSVGSGQSITLTSQSGRIPLTVVNGTGYPVTAAVTITTDGLTFANGTNREVLPGTSLDRVTNVIYVNVVARSPGEFRLNVTLTSPDGSLQLAKGVVTIRSTATSFVGILLSLGAIAVLAAWWIRTALSRRAERRGARRPAP